MESIFVNWETLDSLVIEFAKSENLFLEDDSSLSSSSSSSSSPPSSSPSSSYRSRLVIRQIRRSLEIGEVDVAIDLFRVHAPFLLDDHRLLFRLQKQKFIELLRKGTDKDRRLAIQCSRTALAPCALDAYPEAYEEFKHVLLALIFKKDDQTSPVANEWSLTRRFDIAGYVASVLRAQLNAYDPIFSMTLRYLISIHKGYCLRQGIASPISDLTERLLLEERDPPPIPEDRLYEAPPFDEVDIQALAHAVELTRQGAVDSLRFSKGDLFRAFQNELCRMKLDVAMVDQLVHEYCVYRGIIDGSQTPGGSSMSQPNPGYSSSRDCSPLSMDCGTSKPSSEMISANAVVDSSKDVNVEAMSRQVSDSDLRSACEVTSNREDCSTSEVHHANFRGFQRSRSCDTGEKHRRKRWRGRVEEVEGVRDVSSAGTTKQDPEGNTSEEQHLSKLIVNNNDNYKYEFVLEMKDFACKGMATEVVEEVNTVDPNFFVQNPVLFFQFKQVEFLKLVNSGDHSGALRVACSYMGPLAARDPTLLKPLKETLLALLRPEEDAFTKVVPFSVLATSLQAAMSKRLGIEEPQLMKLMRATLHTHDEWFKLQMCKDRFEGMLKINSLKELNTPLLIDDTSKISMDICTPGSSQVTISSNSRMAEDGSSPTQVSSGDIVCDENAILKVMEFLALPRADAIHLLAQYNWNAETVIQQIFA